MTDKDKQEEIQKTRRITDYFRYQKLRKQKHLLASSRKELLTKIRYWSNKNNDLSSLEGTYVVNLVMNTLLMILEKYVRLGLQMIKSTNL